MQSPNDLQRELAEHTGWQGLFIVSGPSGRLFAYAPRQHKAVREAALFVKSCWEAIRP